MRKLSLILFLSLFGFQLYGQVVNLGDAELATKIKKSTKPYKVVYILCDYCEPSLVLYPQIYSCFRDARMWTFILFVHRAVRRWKLTWKTIKLEAPFMWLIKTGRENGMPLLISTIR